jgi:hypothetical protein
MPREVERGDLGQWGNLVRGDGSPPDGFEVCRLEKRRKTL